MAGLGPTVKLVFAGDAAQLDKTMASVSDGADKMGRRVQEAGGKFSEAGDRVESLKDAAGEGDTKMMGFRDTITGLQDSFKGFTDSSLSLDERLLTLGMGFGDLFSGLENFLIPTFARLGTLIWGTMIPAVWSFTTALLANPITWIVLGVIALVAALYALIFHFDWVKSVATAVINWIGDRFNWVKNLVSNVAGWIRDRFVDAFNWVRSIAGGVFDWFGSLPGRIGGVFSSIGDGIRSAFRAAFNFVADIWNNTIGRISVTIPGWVPVIGGNSFSVPKIPKFHTGGVVPGAPGSEMLAILQAGETVIPANGGGGSTLVIKGDGSPIAAVLIEVLSKAIRGQGGNVQEVLGS